MVRFALIKTILYTYIRSFIGIFVLLVGWGNLHATHNLAGQITAEYLGNNTFEITLTTYTDPAPAGVDRCAASIEIWSVGPNPQLITILEDIPRANGDPQINPPNDCPIRNPLNGVPIYGSVKKNIYVERYTFVGPGSYQLRYYDIARREDVINMADPGSTAFYVETEINFLNPILGENNTPILLNDPLDEACAGQLWSHNPGGLDPDGDSLIYELRPSFQYEPIQGINPSPVVDYIFPDDPSVYENGPLTMDRFTGLMRWDVPNNFGTYNIAYIIKEYRNGRLLGYVVRDMAIFVKNCDNNPPVIETIEDTCVYAGASLEIPFKAYDPDFLDSLYLELNNAGLGNNGPFSVPNSAEVEGIVIDQLLGNRGYVGLPERTENNVLTIDTITGTISWETVCENIRTQPYQIDLFAHDDNSYITSPVQVRLTANKVVTINVIPPPPEGLSATKDSRRITLDWLPTTCTNALGYNVYRRLNNTPYMQDTICCEMSPQDAGYELISFVEGWENTSFLDSLNEVNFDEELCYLVTAIYPDAFNPSINALIESCATNQICVEVFNDKLYLTNVSVENTDPVNGEMWIHWEKPDSIDAFFPRPFTLKLFRGNHTEEPTEEIATFDFDTDSTGWRDTPLDTETQGYNYKIELYDALDLAVQTDVVAKEGSSIYLETQGGNNAVTLSWSEFVPWRNEQYEIYRSEDAGPFALLTTVNGTGASNHTYRDGNLSPNVEYCYFVKSIGRYLDVPSITRELINYSQESCSFAIDIEPPCNPMLTLTGDCEELTHVLTITKSMGICANDADLITLYFASTPTSNFTVLNQFAYSSFGEDTVLTFDFSANPGAFAGCYAISSTDTLGNTSEQSEALCVDFCPDLEMGNVFSPNNDGINDYFTPVFYRDVQLIEFVVYDRWGRLMHRNISDIERLWEGNMDSSGKNAAEGVYYYYIRYEELGLTENVPREEKGWVTLLR